MMMGSQTVPAQAAEDDEDYRPQLEPSKITYMMDPLRMYRPGRPSLGFMIENAIYTVNDSPPREQRTITAKASTNAAAYETHPGESYTARREPLSL
ncbi:hypothetical protein Tco_1006365 [Tanacetum coccineum]|uniref:Uncharacterized protein n=1 Tax=Tanacetum coccineum TaxID=301880 RepID=A0ABQ5FJE3_9ASTR